jgi:hypothetical protein
MRESIWDRFFKRLRRRTLDREVEEYSRRLAKDDEISVDEVVRAHLSRLALDKDPERRARSIEVLSSINSEIAAPLAVRELARYTKSELSEIPSALYLLMLDVAGAFTLRRVREDAQSFLTLMSFGIDPNTSETARYMPIRVYLSEDDPSLVSDVSRRIADYSEALGLEFIDELLSSRGSWYKRWFARTKEALSRDEVVRRLEKAERAIELVALHKEQALVDRNQAEAAARLIESLANVPNAACQIGSILVAKVTDATGTRVFTRSLTPQQMIFLERHQAILSSPGNILQRLEESQATALEDSSTSRRNQLGNA